MVNSISSKRPIRPASGAGNPGPGLRLKAQFRTRQEPNLISRVLVVDDIRSELHFIECALLKLGLEPVLVNPEQSIRQQVLRLAPDCQLVIMDGKMPGRSGAELIAELRQERGYPGYILANSSDAVEQKQMLTSGADLANTIGDPLEQQMDGHSVRKSPNNFKNFFESATTSV